jgi:hypothetical protein
MSLSHLPSPWRVNAYHKLGARVTIRNERNVFVLRCEKAGKGGSRPPKMPSTTTLHVTENQQTTTIIKLSDGECEWWLERVVRRTLGG